MTVRDALAFPRVAGVTTGLTLALVTLGVYTAATGSGLACSAQWPLCDNGLLPRTIPSFVEWFHRLVAMLTGWCILGTALWSWRRPDPRPRRYATLAAVLLPLQVGVGAVTVTLSGLFPDGYSPPTQGVHLVVALAIFSLLVLTTLSAREFEGSPLARSRGALAVAAVAVVAAVPVSRLFPPVEYAPVVQAAFYGVTLVAVAALLAATRWLGDSPVPNLRVAAGVALAALLVAMLLGRDLVFYTPTVRLVNAAAFVVAIVAVVVALAAAVRTRAPTGPSGSPARTR